MIRCAYCDVECDPTREHVIPAWYVEAVGREDLETFNRRNPIGHVLGDILVKDVCRGCNNGPLSKLDGYARTIYEKSLKHHAFAGESVDFEVDRDMWLRWLLKLCFNSARVHDADVTILRKYRAQMLGIAPFKSEIALLACLVTPTDFGTHPPSPAYRIIGGDDDIQLQQWFRLVQTRMEENVTDLVQRQVYVDGFCFTMFVPDPDEPRHQRESDSVVSSFLKRSPGARYVPNTGRLTLRAGAFHAAEAMESQIENFPSRHLGQPKTDCMEFRDAIAGVGSRQTLIALQLSREEFETCHIRLLRHNLYALIADGESALAFKQRVGLFTDAYDDDPRELWEIPEPRKFFRELFIDCPFLFFLAAPGSGTLRLLLACCCSYERREDGALLLDQNDVKRFYDAGFSALNEVTHRFAFSMETNKQISNDLLNELKRAGQP